MKASELIGAAGKVGVSGNTASIKNMHAWAAETLCGLGHVSSCMLVHSICEASLIIQ